MEAIIEKKICEDGSTCNVEHRDCSRCYKYDADGCFEFSKFCNKLKKEWRDKRVDWAIKYLDKHLFEYAPTKTTNIVELDYHIQKYRFSLNHFEICIGNKWIEKKKGRLLKPDTEIKFGKYKGKKLNEINDMNYINWLMTETDIMIHPDIFTTE